MSQWKVRVAGHSAIYQEKHSLLPYPREKGKVRGKMSPIFNLYAKCDLPKVLAASDTI